jgi:hypothetical protein
VQYNAVGCPWRAEDLLVPRSIQDYSVTRCSLFREVRYDQSGPFPPSAGLDAIDGVSFYLSGADVLLEMGDISGEPSAVERAVGKLGVASEKWIAYLRVALPREGLFLGNLIKVLPSARIQTLRLPENRRFWTTADTRAGFSRLLRARARMSEEDRERLDAAMTWAGLAMSLWSESPVRALALMWMSLEVLFGDLRHVYDVGRLPYLKRLPVELGSEVVRHVTRRAATQKPAWSAGFERRDGPISRYVAQLAEALKDIPDETVLVHRVSTVLEVLTDDGRAQAGQRLRRDLAFIYAARNGMAHMGASRVTPTMAHYLINVAIEVLKTAVGELTAANELEQDISSFERVMRRCGEWLDRSL